MRAGVMVTAAHRRSRPPQRSSAAAARAFFAKAQTPELELEEVLYPCEAPPAPLQPRRKRGRPRKYAADSPGDAAALVLKRTRGQLWPVHQPAVGGQIQADETTVTAASAVPEGAPAGCASVLRGGTPSPRGQVSVGAAVAAVPTSAPVGPGSTLGRGSSSPCAQVSMAAAEAVSASLLDGSNSVLGGSLPFMLTPLQSGSLGLAAPWSRCAQHTSLFLDQ